MTNKTDNNIPDTDKGQAIAYGYWPFFRAWIITLAIMTPIILILKYWVKLI